MQQGDTGRIPPVQVLMELKEYAYAEVDVDFVRKAVRAIGRCALKIESSAERCVAVLVDLIQVGPFPLPFPLAQAPLAPPVSTTSNSRQSAPPLHRLLTLYGYIYIYM